eukprot:2316984-Ditylum_brightwellii.AAC.1
MFEVNKELAGAVLPEEASSENKEQHIDQLAGVLFGFPSHKEEESAAGEEDAAAGRYIRTPPIF